MAKRALISDIHGNLEALQAVLADIDSKGIKEIYCLGDIIGYGPNPCECLDLVMRRCAKTILGNHDQAALFDPEGFNPTAFKAIEWTRRRLDASTSSSAQINERWDFLGELPREIREGDLKFVHGSPRDPTNEYVFPEFIHDQAKMETLFGRIDHLVFMGHTHLPGVFTTALEFHTPEEFDHSYTCGSEKLMFNVGSVGQPRDEINKACYAVLDQDASTVDYFRIDYDREKTSKKIYDESDLPNSLGDRLHHGR